MDERAVPGVARIAVLRAGGLGDLVLSLPALEALRAAYPDAEITLLGRPWHAEFLRGRPSPVDAVVVVPVATGVREEPGEVEDETELRRFFDRMEDEHFDLAVQLDRGGRGATAFVRRLGARLAVGACLADAEPLDRWMRYVPYQPELLRCLEVVSLVGAEPRGVEPRVTVTKLDLDEAERALAGLDGPFAVLHPGAGDGRRCWPPEKFALVGDGLGPAGVGPVITGSEHDRDLVARVAAGMRQPALALAGRLTLNGLAGLLSLASVVVANDTGARHLAEAVGASTVGIYWCGNVITSGPATRAWHRTAVSWRLDCPVCGVDATRARCPHERSFVVDVRADEVLASARELLALAEEDDGTSPPSEEGTRAGEATSAPRAAR